MLFLPSNVSYFDYVLIWVSQHGYGAGRGEQDTLFQQLDKPNLVMHSSHKCTGNIFKAHNLYCPNYIFFITASDMLLIPLTNIANPFNKLCSRQRICKIQLSYTPSQNRKEKKMQAYFCHRLASSHTFPAIKHVVVHASNRIWRSAQSSVETAMVHSRFSVVTCGLTNLGFVSPAFPPSHTSFPETFLLHDVNTDFSSTCTS